MKNLLIHIRQEWALLVAGSKLDTLFLFAASASFSIYLALGPIGRDLSAMLWSVLFWVIQLFSAMQISERMYGSEFQQQKQFYYQNSRATEVLYAKFLVQAGFQFLLALSTSALFSLLFGTTVVEWGFLLSSCIWGSIAITALFQVVGALSSATSNPGRYTAVLGTPIAIPVLLEAIRASKRALDGLEFSWKAFATLPAFSALALALAVLLYPHIWHE